MRKKLSLLFHLYSDRYQVSSIKNNYMLIALFFVFFLYIQLKRLFPSIDQVKSSLIKYRFFIYDIITSLNNIADVLILKDNYFYCVHMPTYTDSYRHMN